MCSIMSCRCNSVSVDKGCDVESSRPDNKAIQEPEEVWHDAEGPAVVSRLQFSRRFVGVQ